jgi:hypothetical protein
MAAKRSMPEILLANWSIESTTLEMDFLEVSASSTRAGSRRASDTASDTNNLRYLEADFDKQDIEWVAPETFTS